MQTPQILQQLNGSQNQISALLPQIKKLKEALNGIQNPQAYLNNIIQQNPHAQQLILMANGDYDKALRGLCQQKGIDYQQFMEALK